MVKYKIEKHHTGEDVITEDGHTMFIQDILTRLQRLDFLENK